MPSCIAQDIAENRSYSEALVPSGDGAPRRAAPPPAVHDCNWCRIADQDKGERCAPGICRHRGKNEPKAKCPHEKASAREAAAELSAAGEPAKRRRKPPRREAKPRPRAR